jgi:formylglycine-generating enzyme required for sulfatase activity
VTGFDLSDITLTGATAGTFAQISASVYTLVVTGTGGTVRASVAGNAATVGAPYTGNAVATFSNFYQDTWTISLPGSVPMELIRLPAGSFTMGSPGTEVSHSGDETEHPVTLTQDFYLGKTEVTQDQWTALQSFPQGQSFVGGTMPVHDVSHDDIGSWMSALDNHVTEPGTFSLPTESQWEYAARAGTTTRFHFGDGLSTDEGCALGGGREDSMWFCGNNSPNGTKAVGQKLPNAWGLRDMHGNVWEWCADWYGGYPGTVTDPTGPASGSQRVLRGGAWNLNAQFCRSALRGSDGPSSWSNNIGFRVLAVR